FLTTLTLTNSSDTWFDSASAVNPSRFYRALKIGSPTAPEFADEFRLIDHQGISRSLYYNYSYDETSHDVTAVVLIFTGNGCSNVQQLVSTINSLRTNFTPTGVVFCMMDSIFAANLSTIFVLL